MILAQHNTSKELTVSETETEINLNFEISKFQCFKLDNCILKIESSAYTCLNTILPSSSLA